MKLGFVGLGFVGLTTGCVFASKGVEVLGYDIDCAKLEYLGRDIVPFYEPSLQELLQKASSEGFFKVEDNLERLVSQCDIIFVTVGTPSNKDGSINLSHVFAAAESIGSILHTVNRSPLIVIKSTVLPGTAKRVKETILKTSKRDDITVCSNPEFLREGTAVHDTLYPHLIVIGYLDNNIESSSFLKEFYEKVYSTNLPQVMVTSASTAEMIKYTNNAFLATKVSFVNMIANICQRVEGCDVEAVAKAIGMDPRIGSLFLRAGPGYGGSCLPKDVKALISFAKSVQYDPLVLTSVDMTNRRQPYEVLGLLQNVFPNISGKKIAVLGLAFKKDSDDVRDAISIPVINALLEKGAMVQAYDPKAVKNAARILDAKVIFCNSSLQCISGCDCCIILTEWDEFKQLAAEDFKKNMRRPVVIDSRRIFDPTEFEKTIEFYGTGRHHT